MNAATDLSPGTAPRRLPRAALAALVAILLVLGAAASTAQAAVPKSFFGVSAVRPEPKDFKRMHDMGVGSFRIEIAWPAVQPSKQSGYNWAGYDARFRQAAVYGVKPQPIVFGTPAWVSGKNDAVVGPVKGKKQREPWMAFMRAAASRYGPGGDFWTSNPDLNGKLAPNDWLIWNEQNARNFWHPKVSPKDYAALLRITRRAFDDVNPKLKMTTGGMFGYPGHKNSLYATKFLKRLYRQKGAKKAIDSVALHPYASNVGGVKKQIKAARKIMKKAGDRRARIVIGEIGWASGGKPKKYFLIKNRQGQAKRLNKTYKLLLNKRKSWNIRAAFWFTFKDYGGAEVCNWCPKAGLLNKRGKYKPSGSAYKKLIDKKTG